ncbi:MAG TPA: carbon starvation CstA family protein [bacterium]|nr:carbon starvation CstA family protein [bacterium]
MTVLLYLGVAIVAYVLAGWLYAAFLARNFGEDVNNPTPACTFADGRDFVATKPYVLFAHHFSTIAGAGPIVGPTMAILYGYLPAWAWVVLGGIFVGAVHDYSALFVCMREGGKSMAEVARKSLGPSGFVLFILFTLIMLVLVTSAFLSMVAVSLTSLWPLAKLGLAEGQTLLHTEVVDGVVNGRIGGIASTSVVIITVFSPVLGWLIYKKNITGKVAYPLATAVCVGSILAGIAFPVMLSANAWTVIISIYVFFAAGVPVWIILQPRDFINVQILYAGIAILLISLLIGGVSGAALAMPAFNIAEGVKNIGFIWPMMFIMIACGAISGFHSLVAGGTTGKQLANECDARRIGYNAMLLESLLAVCVLLALGIGLGFDDYKAIVWPAAGSGLKSNPVLAFSLAAGHLVHTSLHIPMDVGTVIGVLMVEGFVITTLDSAIRLNRYLFEELWAIMFKNPPAILKNSWFNSGLSVALMWVLAYSNAFSLLWPIFGAANQLLAALALVTITVWLMAAGKRYVFALAPAIFMMVTTLASLVILLETYFAKKSYTLIVTDFLLLALSVGVIVLMVRKIGWRMKTAG